MCCMYNNGNLDKTIMENMSQGEIAQTLQYSLAHGAEPCHSGFTAAIAAAAAVVVVVLLLLVLTAVAATAAAAEGGAGHAPAADCCPSQVCCVSAADAATAAPAALHTPLLQRQVRARAGQWPERRTCGPYGKLDSCSVYCRWCCCWCTPLVHCPLARRSSPYDLKDAKPSPGVCA